MGAQTRPSPTAPGPTQPDRCYLGPHVPSPGVPFVPKLSRPPGSLAPPTHTHRISSYCKSKGWQRIQDSRREDYRLKWCEIRCRDSYHSFREGSGAARRGGWGGGGPAAAGHSCPGSVAPGEQLLFQLPNNKLLTTKIGLLSALREHSRAAGTGNKAALCAPAR